MSIDVSIEQPELRNWGEYERAGKASLEHDEDWSFLRARRAPAPVPDSDPLTVVDLFSGLGGMSIGALEGARRAGRGARLELAADLAVEPLDVLRSSLDLPRHVVRDVDLADLLRLPGEPILASERLFFEDVPNASILVAGPPCQGHSALNNHTRHDDIRNDLYLAVARAAEILRPRMAIIENVRGVGNDRRGAMARCRDHLESLGYLVTAERLDLSRLGVPQTRVRHVMVATLGRPLVWDLRATPVRTVRWAIEDLLDIQPTHLADTPSTPTPTNRERIDWLFDEDEYDLPNPRRPVCHQSKHSYVSMYGRLRWHRPAQTITSGFGSMGQGRYVHPERRRTLTAHEAARLQFLPDFVDLSSVTRRNALADMIGNVAPPALTIALVQAAIEQDLL